jgi:lipopolysaccharide transport protein LptA
MTKKPSRRCFVNWKWLPKTLGTVVIGLWVGAIPAAAPAAGQDEAGSPGDGHGFPTRESLERELGRDGTHLKEPVDIGAEKLNVDLDSHTIVFAGSVRVRQGDLQMTAQEVRAVYGDDVNDIVELAARGDVTVQKGDKTAFGQEALYDRRKATILLTGQPYLKQGENYIRGDRILVRLEEEQMEVQGDVKAEFRPRRPAEAQSP